jgi:hypothetical protein
MPRICKDTYRRYLNEITHIPSDLTSHERGFSSLLPAVAASTKIEYRHGSRTGIDPISHPSVMVSRAE